MYMKPQASAGLSRSGIIMGVPHPIFLESVLFKENGKGVPKMMPGPCLSGTWELRLSYELVFAFVTAMVPSESGQEYQKDIF